jgi:hypothetical protein
MAVRLSFLKSPTFFIAAPVILCVCLLEIAFPYLNRLEWMTFDLRVRLAHSLQAWPPTAPPILAWWKSRQHHL